MAINDPSANFGWNVPNPGADVGAWGPILNAVLAEDGGSGVPGIDAVLGDVRDLAEAALPASGGEVDGDLEVSGQLMTAGSLVLAQPLDSVITNLGSGNNNNVATAGPASGPFQRLVVHSSGSTITGFAGGVTGKMIVVSFRTLGGDLTLANQSTASTSTNRLSLPDGVNQVLPETTLPRALVFYYDFSSWVLGI